MHFDSGNTFWNKARHRLLLEPTDTGIDTGFNAVEIDGSEQLQWYRSLTDSLLILTDAL